MMVVRTDLLDERVEEMNTEDGVTERNDLGLAAGLEGDVLLLSRLHVFNDKSYIMFYSSQSIIG